MPVDPDTFKQVLSRFPSGVTVVTVRVGDLLNGMTASAFTSVSLDPPLILVCVGRANVTHDLIPRAGAFAINILGEEQQALSERFAVKAELGAERFLGIPHRTAVTGAPILEDALAFADCRLYAAHEAGDHTIYVGQVESGGVGEEQGPLVYFRSRYLRLPHP